MVRLVMYWSFAKRSMTSSMDLNMQGNPRARRLASERTLTHGLGQDNQSRAGARRVRGRDGGNARPRTADYGLYWRVCFFPGVLRLASVLWWRGVGRPPSPRSPPPPGPPPAAP